MVWFLVAFMRHPVEDLLYKLSKIIIIKSNCKNCNESCLKGLEWDGCRSGEKKAGGGNQGTQGSQVKWNNVFECRLLSDEICEILVVTARYGGMECKIKSLLN